MFMLIGAILFAWFVAPPARAQTPDPFTAGGHASSSGPSTYALLLLAVLVLLGLLVFGGSMLLLTRRSKRARLGMHAVGGAAARIDAQPSVIGRHAVAYGQGGAMMDGSAGVPVAAVGWHLAVTVGADAGRIFPLGMRAQVGRAAQNEVLLNDGEASRHHALIEWRQNGYVISALGSSHGTFVNGARLLQSAWLGVGDVVQVGATQLTVRAVGPAAPTGGAPYPPVAMPMPGGAPPAPFPTPATGAPSAERGGCLTFNVLLYFVGWSLLWAIAAAALYYFTREPLAVAGVGVAALISLILMVTSLSGSWQGQIVDIRTEQVRVRDDDGDTRSEDQRFAYIQQPNRRRPRRMRAMGGWQVGDWLEKRRGETTIRVSRGQ